MKTLYQIYLNTLVQQSIISEGIFDKITEKVSSIFNCFNKISDLSKMILGGKFNGNCTKFAQVGKDALGTVTSSISLLKKPTDALMNLGTDKIGPLFVKPLNICKSGGNLNNAVKSLLDDTKSVFGKGAQDALKGKNNTISQEINIKVNKKFNLFLESRCFHRKQSHTVKRIERAFRYLIQENVNNAYNKNSMYYSLTKPITINTTHSIIKIYKSNNENLVYEERQIGKFAKPIIIESKSQGIKQLDKMFADPLISNLTGQKLNAKQIDLHDIDRWFIKSSNNSYIFDKSSLARDLGQDNAEKFIDKYKNIKFTPTDIAKIRTHQNSKAEYKHDKAEKEYEQYKYEQSIRTAKTMHQDNPQLQAKKIRTYWKLHDKHRSIEIKSFQIEKKESRKTSFASS